MMKRLFLMTLASASLAQAAENNELLIFANPSLRRISWETPSKSLKSAINSEFHNQIAHGNPGTVTASVGHIVVRFRCRDSNGRTHDEWTGMTGQNDFSETSDDLFKKKIGLGTLFKSYADGSIDPPKKSLGQVVNYRGRLERDVDGRKRRVLPAFLRVPLDTDSCDSVVRLLKTFRAQSWDKVTPVTELRARPRNEVLNFGFAYDAYDSYRDRQRRGSVAPLGGGCTSFAMAFLKVAGAFEPIFEQRWKKRLKISEKLIGDGGAHQAPVMSIMFGSLGGSWNYAGWNDRRLDFYDVQLVWDFIRGAQVCLRQRAGLETGRMTCDPAIASWLHSKGSRAEEGALTVNGTGYRSVVTHPGSPRSPVPARTEFVPVDRTVERTGLYLD
jgi:hypothetical protein